MSRNKLAMKIAAAALTSAAAAGAVVSPAAAATAPVSNSHVLIHYSLAAGDRPENVTAVPGGDFYDTLSQAAKVERVTPQGGQSVVASLPKPPDGGINTPVLHFQFLSGIVRMPDGTLYLGYATGTNNLTGIWRVRPGHTPQRVIALSAKSMPNGMALDPQTDEIYFADAPLGIIWRFSAKGGPLNLVKWATSAKLGPGSGPYGLGVNGLKVYDNAVWTSNSDQATLLRIPIQPDGTAGAIETKLTGPAIDDFIFIGHSNDIVAALDPANEVALIKPDGSYSIVLRPSDGLEGPTSAVIIHGKLYVMSAAFLTHTGPNIVVADINIHDATHS
jgi:hypothetical protein